MSLFLFLQLFSADDLPPGDEAKTRIIGEMNQSYSYHKGCAVTGGIFYWLAGLAGLSSGAISAANWSENIDRNTAGAASTLTAFGAAIASFASGKFEHSAERSYENYAKKYDYTQQK